MAKDLNVGDRIRHSTFGEGFVTKYEPSTAGDVIITAAFDNRVGIKRLLLGKAPMEKIEEQIEGRKSPRIYSTEFKSEVVKQALTEGRTVVRKQYNLPEATLRNWIKQFNKWKMFYIETLSETLSADYARVDEIPNGLVVSGEHALTVGVDPRDVFCVAHKL